MCNHRQWWKGRVDIVFVYAGQFGKSYIGWTPTRSVVIRGYEEGNCDASLRVDDCLGVTRDRFSGDSVGYGLQV